VKPDVDKLLEVAAGHLMTRLAPALGAGYEQSNTAALGVLLLALREEVERGAQRRVQENHELRRLFRKAAPAIADAGLRERLVAAAATHDTSLAVSDLERDNATLRGLLVELHVHVEELDSPKARRLEDEIWRELAASTERRRLSIAVF